MVALALYRGAAAAAGPIVRRHLRRRLRAGKEDPARLGERFGRPSAPRPDGALVWIHAASVGEAVSVLPLVDRLRGRAGLGLLMTTSTVTSARLLADRLPAEAVHQFAPIDRPGWVRAFLDHWRPGLALRVESELWPATLGALSARGIPAVLVNARLSPRSFRGWRCFPPAGRALLGAFALCLARSEADAARLRALGARKVRCLGDLKEAAPALPADAAALAALRRQAAGRRVWLAASTHPGEEEAAAQAHAAVRRAVPDALLVVVPRHPERGPGVARALAASGRDVRLKSRGDRAGGEVYVADGLGELGLYFRLAEIVFMGGSLVARGGQNPLEPARLGCAILHGPHMENFAETAAALAGAARVVAGPDALAAALAELFADDALRARLAARAAAVAERGGRGVLDRVADALAPFVDDLVADAAA